MNGIGFRAVIVFGELNVQQPPLYSTYVSATGISSSTHSRHTNTQLCGFEWLPTVVPLRFLSIRIDMPPNAISFVFNPVFDIAKVQQMHDKQAMNK